MSVLNPNIPDGSQPLGVFKLSGSIDVSAQLLAPPPDPGQRPEHCSVCNNVGYLLGQTYGTAEIPEGWTPVQACDTCMAFSTDGLAAWSAKLALQAAGVAYFPSAIDDNVVVAFGVLVGEGSEGQGEWAILWTPDQPADPDAPSLPSAGVSDAEIAHTLELLAAALPRTIDSAGAVLAMPELQAIIALLRHERDQWCCLDCWLMHLSRYNTPLTVIAWIDQTGADHG